MTPKRPKKLSPEELEEKLAVLRELALRKTKVAKEYEELRDELTPYMDEVIPFIDEEGNKRWASRVQAEEIILDPDILVDLVDEDLFAEVIKVTIDKDAFRKAVAAERISPAIVAKVASTKLKAASVRFSDKPTKDADAMSVSFEDDTG